MRLVTKFQDPSICRQFNYIRIIGVVIRVKEERSIRLLFLMIRKHGIHVKIHHRIPIKHKEILCQLIFQTA